MFTPGAATSTSGPTAVVPAGASMASVEPTATTSGHLAGHATPFAPVLPEDATTIAPPPVAYATESRRYCGPMLYCRLRFMMSAS